MSEPSSPNHENEERSVSIQSGSEPDNTEDVREKSVNESDHHNENAQEADSLPGQLGLIKEFDDGYGTVVLVHGITDLRWNAQRKSETWRNWLIEMGLGTHKLLVYRYDIESHAPDIFVEDGIEREALKLLHGLVKHKEHQEISNDTASDPSDPPHLVFVALDVGGIIVKRALIIASQNPIYYGMVDYLTSALVFFNCPHRSSSLENMEDQIAKLFCLVGPSFPVNFVHKVHELARSVQETNDDFVETKMLTRAAIINVVSSGKPKVPQNKNERSNDNDNDEDEDEDDENQKQEQPSDDLPAVFPVPFNRPSTYLAIPFERTVMTDLSHSELVQGPRDTGNGITSAEDFAPIISSTIDRTPWSLDIKEQNMDFHRMLLSQAPPVHPPDLLHSTWVPTSLTDAIVEGDEYRKWSEKRGVTIIHLYGTRNVSEISQVLDERLNTNWESEAKPERTIFFEFNRHDVRFSNIRAMLTSFLSVIISRYMQNYAIAINRAFERMYNHRGWSLNDLYHTFTSLKDFDDMSKNNYMISRFDQCDGSRFWFLDQISEMVPEQLMRTGFIITSQNDEDLKGRLSQWPSINLDQLKKRDDIVEHFDTVCKSHLGKLVRERPIFADLEPELESVLRETGDDPRLASSILEWLKISELNATKDQIRPQLKSLSSIPPDGILETVLKSLDPQLASWGRSLVSHMKHAVRPMTVQELATLMALEDVKHQTDFDEFVERISKVFYPFISLQNNEVRFGHSSLAPEINKTNEVATAHANTAKACLEYLRNPVIQQDIKRFSESNTELTQSAVFQPRHSLASYAVLYWSTHYRLAGSDRPFTEALEFFDDRDARIAWAEAHYTLSHPFARPDRGFLSSFPLMAMVGLDDLIAELIQREKSSKTFHIDCGLAISETARNGHIDSFRLLMKSVILGGSALEDAINSAASYGEGGVIHELVEYASKRDGFEWPDGLLAWASWLGLHDTVKVLLDSGVKPESPEHYGGRTPLHLACTARNFETVKVLLGAKPDLSAENEFGSTPLHLAAANGHSGITRLLIEAGAELEPENMYGSTPLQNACTSRKPLAFQVLLEAGANPNHGKESGEDPVWQSKPLVFCCVFGVIECLRLLLEHNADIGAVWSKRTSLHHAISYGYLEIGQLLLEKGANPNENPQGFDMVLLRAVENGSKSVELVKLLLDNGARIEEEDNSDTWRNTALARAAGTGNKELVELLLQRGADPNHCGKGSQSPLYVAAWAGKAEIVRLLLEAEADINFVLDDSQWGPLHACYNNAEVAKVLLEHGADPNAMSTSGTPLHLATQYGSPLVVKALVSHNPKSDLEIPSPDESYKDFTAVAISCSRADIKSMRLLLEHGASRTVKTKDGRSLLDLCVESNSVDAVKTLLEYRVSVDDKGNTVLHHITSSTTRAMVKLLVHGGADIYAANKEGLTPLYRAVALDNLSVMKYLLGKGADPNQYGESFGSLLHVACGAGSLEAARTLVEAGADIQQANASSGKDPLLTTTLTNWSSINIDMLKYLVETCKVDIKSHGGLFGYPIITACRYQPSDNVRYLLEHGADPDVEDPTGRRAMHIVSYTATDRSLDLVDVLLEFKAQTHDNGNPIRDKLGRTAVHFAATTGNWNVFQRVSELYGEEVLNMPDNDGWTPLFWALLNPEPAVELISHLLDHGADLWTPVRSRKAEWSPLKLARYIGAPEAVLELLTPKETARKPKWDDKFHVTRRAQRRGGWLCDNCLMDIYGIQYSCTICKDYDLCFRCFMSRNVFHRLHSADEWDEIGEEYIKEEGTDADDSQSRHDSTLTDEGAATPGLDSSEPEQIRGDEDDVSKVEDDSDNQTDDDDFSDETDHGDDDEDDDVDEEDI